MQGGTRGLRGSTSHSRRKTQAPGGEQEETAHGSTRQSRGRQAPGIRQQAAASSGSKAAAASSSERQQHHGSSSRQQQAVAATWQRQQATAGSQSRGARGLKASTASSPTGGTGRGENLATREPKRTTCSEHLQGRRAAFKKGMGRPVCGRRERNGNAFTPTEYKTNQPTQCTALLYLKNSSEMVHKGA